MKRQADLGYCELNHSTKCDGFKVAQFWIIRQAEYQKHQKGENAYIFFPGLQQSMNYNKVLFFSLAQKIIFVIFNINFFCIQTPKKLR